MSGGRYEVDMVSEKFREMLSELDDLGLNRDDFAIFGSGPLGIRGIRESADIDIIVRAEAWGRLCEKYPCENESFIHVGNVDVARDYWKKWFDMDELIDDADVIEGYRFVKLEHVIEWKKARGKEKDLRDVILIAAYLKKNGQLYKEYKY